MTDEAKKVLAGYVRLSAADQSEVISQIAEFAKADVTRKSILREEFTKSAGVWSGPVSSGCPCCGR